MIPAAESFSLSPLTPEHLPQLAAYWRRAHPLHAMPDILLRERLFAEDFDPELALAAWDEAGELAGLAVGVWPLFGKETERIGGIKWLGCLPEHIGTGLIARLSGELEARLRARGAADIKLMATPPLYIRPGVDTRETGLIAELLRLGWAREGVHFNMTCDLRTWRPPEGALILGRDADGYEVRRAGAGELQSLQSFCLTHFSPGWAREIAGAFGHDPISLFLAERDGELAGFAAYEVSQAAGAFGPTGVAPAHRQARLGRRLLWAVLQDLQALDEESPRPVCEIGWVGPVGFYHHGCGAVLGPVYWALHKPLKQQHSHS